MKCISGFALAFLLALGLTASNAKADGPIRLVAAENFYGDVAKQIGGAQVAVVSIMSNPDQDPHLFESSPAIARQMSVRRSSSITAPITIRG